MYAPRSGSPPVVAREWYGRDHRPRPGIEEGNINLSYEFEDYIYHDVDGMGDKCFRTVVSAR